MRALLVVLALALSACTAPAPSAEPSTPRAQPTTARATLTPTATTPPTPAAATAPARPRQRKVERLLARLTITSRRPFVRGYHRSAFGKIWTDEYGGPGGRNGCRTRDDVLKAQLRHVTMRFDDPAKCRVFSGTFVDPYTGTTFPYRGNWLKIEIDHVVPLAAAWHNGAARWPRARRVAFANDVRRNLVATTRRANQAKVSKGPERWLPPARNYRCAYVLRYLEVSVHYRLSISAAEAAAARRVARARC